jgi:hypothetical protein
LPHTSFRASVKIQDYFGLDALVFQLMKDRFDENARISMRVGADIQSDNVHIFLLHFGKILLV